MSTRNKKKRVYSSHFIKHVVWEEGAVHSMWQWRGHFQHMCLFVALLCLFLTPISFTLHKVHSAVVFSRYPGILNIEQKLREKDTSHHIRKFINYSLEIRFMPINLSGPYNFPSYKSSIFL